MSKEKITPVCILKFKKALYCLATVFLISSGPVFGQVILAKVNAADCIKCSVNMQTLATSNTKVPAYIVLSEDKQQESREFIKAWEQLGFRVIFSNKLNKLFNRSISSIIYLNADGKIVLQFPLPSLNSKLVDSIAAIYAKDYKFRCQNQVQYQLSKDDALFSRDNELDRFRLVSGSDTVNYELGNDELKKVEKGIDQLHPGFMDFTREYLVHQPDYKRFVKPAFLTGKYAAGEGLFLVKYPYVQRLSTAPDINYENDTFVINSYYAIVRYKGKVIHSVHPVDFVFTDTSDILSRYFQSFGDTTLLVAYGNPKVTAGKNDRFLAEFVRRGGVFTFKKWYKVDLPQVYKKNNLGYTYITLSNIDYPYYVSGLTQTVVNLKEETEHPFRNAADADFSSAFHTSGKFTDVGTLPFFNKAIVWDKGSDYLYILALHKGEKVIKRLSLKDFTLENVVELKPFTYGIVSNDYDFFQVFPERQMLYASDPGGYVRGYPLELFR